MQIANMSVEIRTAAGTAVVNVTAETRKALARARITRGLAVLTVPHTTCGLCVNEDEPGLRRDLELVTSSLIDLVKPREGFNHDRVDDNANGMLKEGKRIFRYDTFGSEGLLGGSFGSMRQFSERS